MNGKKKFSKLTIYGVFMVVIVGLVVLATIFSVIEIEDTVLASIDYQEDLSSNYRVYYKPNEFYNEPYLGEDGTYISEYVDHIEVDFKYLVEYSKKLAGSYEYQVKANLIAFTPGREDEELWKREYSLSELEMADFTNDSNYQIDKLVSINYSSILSDYLGYQASSPVATSAKLVVDFVANNRANYVGLDEFTYTNKISMELPIGDATFKIRKEVKDGVVRQNVKSVDDNSVEKMFILIIAGLLWVLVIFTSSCLVIVYRNDAKKISFYERMLAKILTTYDSVIVNVENLPSLTKLNVVDVISFEELLDAQNEVRLPINFKEDKRKHVAKFVLVSDGMAWVYTFKEEDLD